MLNRSDQDWEVQQIDVDVVDVVDSDGNLVLRRTLNSNGIRPAIEILGARKVEKRSQLCVFNPFHTLEIDLSGRRLHYELRTGPDLRSAEGLPIYFRNLVRHRGLAQSRLDRDHIGTGDIIGSLLGQEEPEHVQWTEI